MKPIFQTAKGKLYHGDCLEVLQQFQDKQFDLCLTDPPYGIGADMAAHKASGFVAGGKTGFTQYPKRTYRKTEWDNRIPEKEEFEQVFRVSKSQIIWGGNYFTEHILPSPAWIVWDKQNNGNFADCELAWTSFSCAIKKIVWRWNGMLQQDMKNKEHRIHPTQKPVGLFKWCLSKYDKDAKTVIDPYAGSGTTAVACEYYGKNWVLIEKDWEYCGQIIKRLQSVQGSLLELSNA